MTDLEDKLAKLKNMIDEVNYPYFEDGYLQDKIYEITDDITLKSIAKELCLIKSGIEEIKLGDITIPSPRNHFLLLASEYRENKSRALVRADER